MLKVIITAIGVLVLGLVVATGIAIHHSAQQSTVQQLANSPVSGDTAAWNTYQNEEFGFEIEYPAEDFTVAHNSTSSPWLATSPRAEQEIGIVDLHLSNQKYYTATNLREASIWIIMDGQGPAAYANCSQSLGVGVSGEFPSGRSFEIQEINGAVFTKSLESDAGMSHRYEYTIYSTVHDSKCFRIVSFIQYVSMGVFDPGTVSDITDEMRAKLESIVKTFRFGSSILLQ